MPVVRRTMSDVGAGPETKLFLASASSFATSACRRSDIGLGGPVRTHASTGSWLGAGPSLTALRRPSRSRPRGYVHRWSRRRGCRSLPRGCWRPSPVPTGSGSPSGPEAASRPTAAASGKPPVRAPRPVADARCRRQRPWQRAPSGGSWDAAGSDAHALGDERPSLGDGFRASGARPRARDACTPGCGLCSDVDLALQLSRKLSRARRVSLGPGPRNRRSRRRGRCRARARDPAAPSQLREQCCADSVNRGASAIAR